MKRVEDMGVEILADCLAQASPDLVENPTQAAFFQALCSRSPPTQCNVGADVLTCSIYPYHEAQDCCMGSGGWDIKTGVNGLQPNPAVLEM